MDIFGYHFLSLEILYDCIICNYPMNLSEHRREVEDYMFASQDFFFDRMEVAKANRWKPKEMLYRYTQMSDDYIKLMHLDMYLNREEKALEKVK